MAGEITAVIDLCCLISDFGLKAYNVAEKLSTNFHVPIEELKHKADDLSRRVRQLKGELEEKNQNHELRGLKGVLESIKSEFQNIKDFFRKLHKYDDRHWFVKIVKRTKTFQSVERKFEDHHCALDSLDELLTKSVPEGILEVVLSNQHVLQEMQHQLNTHELLFMMMKEELRLNTSFGEYMKKRADGDFMIDPSELSDEVILSQTMYSKYSTAILDGRKVVVKRVTAVENQSVSGLFTREARNLIMFSRGSIVRVFGMCDSADEKFLVLEYMEKGTLSKVLQEEELSLKNKIDLALSAAQSLKRMHLKLVHTALRTEKFLVDSEYTAKLSGMGYAITFSSCSRSITPNRPTDQIYFYRAPERFAPCKSEKEADIYGFGIVLWEIFTQTKPFSSKLKGNLNQKTVTKFINDKQEEYELKLQDPINDELSQLVRGCRSFYPKDRPKISEIEQILLKIHEQFQDGEDSDEEISTEEEVEI